MDKATSNAAKAHALSYRPVAIFVGGTSGIGAAMAKAFAEHRNGDAHIIIVGRNREAAEQLIASFPHPTSDSEESEVAIPQYEFVECDASLMKNVRKTAEELVQRLPKVNFLVLSQGGLTTKAERTEEGIDKTLALHYYSRWRFTYELIPLLQKAADANEDAKVMTVLNSHEQPESIITPEKFGPEKEFSLIAAARYSMAASNAMVESFASKYPSLSFIHAYPGFVNTGIAGASEDWKIRLFSPLARLVGLVVGVSPVACAENMWYGLYGAKAGWYRKDSSGEDFPSGKEIGEEVREKLWAHTLEVTGR